jgi:hypothetical protein
MSLNYTSHTFKKKQFKLVLKEVDLVHSSGFLMYKSVYWPPHGPMLNGLGI